jgi:DNA repair exonuclease SbcCD ATPase subunit
MGSGKSSVMNAICFGLFGTFPDLQARKVKLDDIIMNKPSVKNESQVIVNFTVDNKKYSVMRVIERDKGTTYSEIREGEKLLDAPNSQRVTDIVEKLLKIDYELFSRAIYSEQNGLDYFLRLPRGERMKRIDNLLMIDRFEKVRSTTVTLRNKVIERKNAKESVVNLDNVKGLKKSLEDIKYSLEKLNKTKNALSEELETKKSKKEVIGKEIKRFEEIEEKLDSLRQKKNSIEGSLKELQSSVDKYTESLKGKKLEITKQKLREIRDLVEKYREELKIKREKYGNLTKEISEKETKINFIKKRIEELKGKIKERSKIKEEIDKITKKFGEEPDQKMEKEKRNFQEIQRKITEIKTKITQTNESLSKISEIEGKCPTCESEISKKKKKGLIKSYEERIENFTQDLLENKENLEEKQKKLKELEKVSRDFSIYHERMKDLERIKEELKEKSTELKTYLEVLSRKKENFDKIKEKIPEIEKTYENSKDRKQKLQNLIEKLEDFGKKKIRKKHLSGELEEVKDRVSNISKKYKGKDIKLTREEYTIIVSRISELMTRIQGLNDIIGEKTKRKEEYNEELEKIEKQKEEIEKLEKIIKDLKIFEMSLEKTQSELRENFVDTVNYTMDQIWSDIYPYDDFISARLAIEDRDYILQVQRESGKWIEVEGIVSGGERSIASLVLRMAFSTVLAPQLKWLVLDEPTHNLDSRAIDDLSETLRTKIDNFADQLFLITHEKRLENAVTGNLYKLVRHREKGDVTKSHKIN